MKSAQYQAFFNLMSVEQLIVHDSTLFKTCLKGGPERTCEGIMGETYRMLQGAEFIKNTAEGPHITSKHRHITINGYSLTQDTYVASTRQCLACVTVFNL